MTAKSLYWVSCKKFTVGVITLGRGSQAEICETAPITRKFIGQPLSNLAKWAQKLGGFKVALIAKDLE